MESIVEINRQLNQLCTEGKPMEAFERFYADSVVMQENNESPREGKAVNRAACQEFVDQAPDLKMELLASATEGTTSFTQWRFLYTAPDGSPIDYQEVTVRTWQAGKVVHEQFYYGN